MNEFFSSFIQQAKKVAAAKGLGWDIEVDGRGIALNSSGWNLTKLSGDVPPPIFYLRALGADRTTLRALKTSQGAGRQIPAALLDDRPLSAAWQDLVKAVVVDQLFVRRNTPDHALSGVARPLRVLATCVEAREPWELTLDDIVFALSIAEMVQGSGKLADLLFGVVKTVLDANELTDAGPLSLALERAKRPVSNRARFAKSEDELRSDLEERKRAERLPERRAFWELVRIVFTEDPKCFRDAVRFVQIHLLLLTGLRVGEAALLPADWKRYRYHRDRDGIPCGKIGGFSRSLMLRHFAEKNRTAREDSLALFETTQHVLPIFEEILAESLDKAVSLTEPLRRTLRRQIETGRILPDYGKDQLVRAIELYTYLTGNPFILDLPASFRERFKAEYQADYDPRAFDLLRRFQMERLSGHRADRPPFSSTMYTFFNRWQGPRFRTPDGRPIAGDRIQWDSAYLHIGEVEKYLRRALDKKQSDITPLKLAAGQIPAWQLMFLAPKHAAADIRNGGVCDISRYYAVGRTDGAMIRASVCSGSETLFAEYGQTDEDRSLLANPHSFRHLLNAELFRLSVADTIITKHFSRRSVPQSYEYDHRSLAEDLAAVDLPGTDLEVRLGPKTSTLARMIKAGKAGGPIVEAFRRIQIEEGDAAAFDFLRAEADGFHATPYGYCVNSFTVDPCPKHLECFSGCRHLTATGMPEHRRNLVQLQARLTSAIETIQARPSESVGRANQLCHALSRLEGVRDLLAAPPGAQAFPGGPDLSQIATRIGGVFDGTE